MATLLQRIQARIGTTTELVIAEQALEEATANLYNALPPDKGLQYATEKSALGSVGVEVRGRVLDIRVGDRRAEIIPYSRSKDVVAGSTNSIYAASETFPVAWTRDGQWFAYPTTESVSLLVLDVPNISLSDTAITNSPYGTEELAVLYACWQVLGSRIYLRDIATLGVFPAVPTAPTTPNFTYTDAVAGTIGAVSIGALPTLGSYTKPTHTPPAEPTIATLTIPSAPDPAVVVGSPSFSYTDAVEGTIATTTIGALPTAPTYNGPSSLSDLVSTLSEGAIGTALDQTNPATWFSVLSKLIENEEDPELAQQAIGRINQFVNAGTAEIQNAVASFNEGLEEYQASVQRLIEQARLDAQRLAQQAQMETETHLQNEIQTLQAQIAEYQAELEYFAQQVGVYGAEVNANVQEWTANELQGKIQYYFQQYANSLELYMADQQNELNKFQESLADFRADVDREFQQAQITLQQLASQAELDTNVAIQNEIQTLAEQVQAYQAELGLYQAELGSYAQQVQQVVAQYQAEVNEYEHTQQKAASAAEGYHQKYLEKLELLTLSNDGTAINRARS